MATFYDYTFVIYTLPIGTARPVLRWYDGTYDDAGGADDRPVNGTTYDAATEGWVAVSDMPALNAPDFSGTVQATGYLVNTTTKVVTTTTTAATLSERQRAVLAELTERQSSLAWTQTLDAKVDQASRNAAAATIQALIAAPTTFASLWGTNPEAVLSEASLAAPSLTGDTTDNATKAAFYMGNETIERPKVKPRLSYDYNSSAALGPFTASTTTLSAGFLELVAGVRGFVSILSLQFELRNPSSTIQTTIKLQSRNSQLGAAFPVAWTDVGTWQIGMGDTSWYARSFDEVSSGFYDKSQLRVVYVTSGASAVTVLRNVYLTQVILTPWEA